MKNGNYYVVYRQMADNDGGLGLVDVVSADRYADDEPDMPYILGKLTISASKYGRPKFMAMVASGSHDEHACLYCDRGYLDLDPYDMDDIEKLAVADDVDAVWHGGGYPKSVKLPVEWLDHKVRKFTWSGELVQAGTEETQ